MLTINRVFPNGQHKATAPKYTVDHGKPIPGYSNENVADKYPFRQMAVGDSFFLPGATVNNACRIASSASAWTHHKYTCRTVTENGVKGARIWRTK